MAKRIRFTINGTVYHASLLENALAEKIAAMCPFEAQYRRRGNHEYYTALPHDAMAAGCESTTIGHRNGLYYFEDWNALSLVIEDCNTAIYPIYHVGDFEEGMAAALDKAGGHVRMLCECE